MVKFYLIKDDDYDSVWTWEQVLEQEKRGFIRVPYSVYVKHMVKVSRKPKPTKVSKEQSNER